MKSSITIWYSKVSLDRPDLMGYLGLRVNLDKKDCQGLMDRMEGKDLVDYLDFKV